MKAVPHLLLLASLAQFAVSGALAQLAEEYRMWTNTSGKTVEATLVAVDAVAKTLKIKMKDGREFDVPIATLSPADFEYAKTRYAAMQAAPATAPAAPATAPTTAMPATTPAGTPPATPGAPPAPTAPAAPAAPKAKVAVVKKPAPPRPAITVIPLAKFKAPTSNDYLSGIAKVRPRLMQNAAGWAALKARTLEDPVYGKMLENLKASGEDLLATPTLTRVFGEMRGTTTPGSKAIYRMALLSVLNQVDGDLKWKQRAVEEVMALVDPTSFGDWYPAEPEVTADFVVAVALGYDWFRDGFNAQQATAIRTHLIEKGIDAIAAFVEGDDVPDSAKAKAPGATASAKKSAAPKKAPPKKDDNEDEPGRDHMACASALLLAAISLVDEDPTAAKKAADAGSKVFGKGITRFAPAGIWPEGMEAGDVVLDYAAMVIQSLRSASGKDYGLSMLEGIPQAGMARMHMKGPTGQLFNFGDTSARASMREWVSTWLCGLHGNPGIPAITAGAKLSPETALLSLPGHFIYYNPHAAGDGTADSTDFALPGGIVAALRTGWTKDDMFVALKGGNNRDPNAQLDIGSFVLDAGGQRWGIELGVENDRVPAVKPAADRTKRYALYLEGTVGQNTLTIDGNQDLEARAAVLLGNSTPERSLAVVDMSKAYSKPAKDVHRGAMIVRGAKPYIVLQDDLIMKNSGVITWSMHTKAEIAADGTTATLTQGGKTLVATILSPAGATFSSATPPVPEKKNEQARDLEAEKVRILKATLPEGKGPQSLCITFSLDAAAPHTPTPVAEWVKK